MSRKAKKIKPESADNKENPFEKYRGIGNLGIGSGREAIIKYFRELRGHDAYDDRSIEMPTEAEDRAITAAAKSDPDAQPLTSKQLRSLIPMRNRCSDRD